MKSFFLNFELNGEGKVEEFIRQIEDFENNFIAIGEGGYNYQIIDTPIANIYWDCAGGSNCIAGMLYHFLTTRPFEYQHIISGRIQSNGFVLPFAINPKYILVMGDCKGGIHISSFDVEARSIAYENPNSIHLNDLRELKRRMKIELNAYKEVLTEEEFSWVKGGGQVDIPSPRIKAIFKRVKQDNNLHKLFKKIYE